MNPERQIRLYENLGVKIFKKYSPLSGDLVYHNVCKRLGAPSQVINTPESLVHMIGHTRMLERGHGFVFVGGTVYAAQEATSGNLARAAIIMVLNAGANLYPVMLQRYNRLRLERVLDRKESASTVQERPVSISQRINRKKRNTRRR